MLGSISVRRRAAYSAGQEAVEGNIHKGRVAHVALPVGEGQLQGLHLQVNGLGTVVAEGRHIESFQDGQGLQQADALGPGTVGEDLAAPIGDGNGFLHGRLVLGKVGQVIQSTQVLQGLDHAAGHVALVVNVAGRLDTGFTGSRHRASARSSACTIRDRVRARSSWTNREPSSGGRPLGRKTRAESGCRRRLAMRSALATVRTKSW